MKTAVQPPGAARAARCPPLLARPLITSVKMFGERDQDKPELRAPRGVARASSQLPVGPQGAALLALQRKVGNRAMTRLLQRAEDTPKRTAAEIKEELDAVREEIADVRNTVADVLEEQLGSRSPVPQEKDAMLDWIEKQGNEGLGHLREVVDELERREKALSTEWLRARNRERGPWPGSGGGGQGGGGPGTAAFDAAPEEAGGTGRVLDEPTVAAERVGEDAAADLAEEAAGTAAEGLTFAETVGAAFEAILSVLDVLFLAQAGYALGKALIFHSPGEMDPEQLKLMQLMDTNVMRAAVKALQAHEQEARKLALRAPERDVYAKVTMTITHGADGSLSQDKSPTMVYDDDQLEDAQFNTVSVGYDSATAKKDGGETHHYADNKDHRRRMQVITFPILLNPLGHSRRLRRFVAMRANAAKAIAKGLSARSIAEGTHWVGDHMGPGGYDWTYLDDREEARRKKAMAPSHRAELELAAKVAFTEAYIDAASDHLDRPAVKKLYDDAVRYYDELQRTTIDPMYRPVTKQPRQQGFPLKPR
jgi:hypothetical protein